MKHLQKDFFAKIVNAVNYSREKASPQMFDRVLSTPLRFVSNVLYIVTYLVVSCHPHRMGINYPAKPELDRNKSGKKTFILGRA